MEKLRNILETHYPTQIVRCPVCLCIIPPNEACKCILCQTDVPCATWKEECHSVQAGKSDFHAVDMVQKRYTCPRCESPHCQSCWEKVHVYKGYCEGCFQLARGETMSRANDELSESI